MVDNIYLKKEKQTSRKQQIRARLSHLNDALRAIDKERIDILADIVKLEGEYKNIK